MKVVFAGTPEFAAGHLKALLASHHQVIAAITQPDKPGKRGKKPVPGPVKQLADESNVPCKQPKKLSLEDLSSMDFDVLVVVAYGQILRADVLEYPKFGCVNVHASLLPRWRGAAPVQRAILAGDTVTGVTIIQMDEGLDTGNMLAKRVIPIDAGETAGSLLDKMLDSGQQALIETLDMLESQTVEPERQRDDETCYAAKIDKQEALIDWHKRAIDVDRTVRAFQPEPVAFCFLENKRIRIHQGHVDAEQSAVTPNRAPGEILDVTRQGITVACGEGSYCITAIQIPVGKGSILKPADVLNGWTDLLHAGAQLSSSAHE